MNALVNELAAIAVRLQYESRGGRLRLAITADEDAALSLHMLATYGIYHRKILGIPLAVEAKP